MKHDVSPKSIPILPEVQLTCLSLEIQNYIRSLTAASRCLTEEVADLKALLAKNCTNSHKAPSTTDIRKPKS
jgi:hypothetical protein